MTEVNDTYRTPEISATEFVDNTQLDFHKATQEAAPYEPTRLAREARNLAFSNDAQPTLSTPESYTLDIPTLKLMSGQIADWRSDTIAGQLNIFDRTV